jgi:hypothetical protein
MWGYATLKMSASNGRTDPETGVTELARKKKEQTQQGQK